MKSKLTLGLTLIMLATLSACSTVEGIGNDISSASRKVSNL